MNQYWFRKREGLFSKDLGWGWIPITIEGWISVILLLSLTVFAGYYLGILTADTKRGFMFLGSILILTILFSLIARRKTRP